jgi:hypothetical protein
MIQISRIRITEREIQRKFNQNEGGYPAQIANLRRVCIYNQLAHQNSKQEPGTRSILDMYYDKESGQKVMTLHYFLKPDGTFGGSGKYDPKELLIGSTMYFK